MKALIDHLRTTRWSHLAVANLRILLGFGLLPAGLKKVLNQPFTDPQNTGTFHEFLHAFYATGEFYQFVGAVQLLIAVLLMTQTFALLGALMMFPVLVTITVFCWSTEVVPTAIVVTLMLLANLALILWDMDRWLPLLRPETTPPAADKKALYPIDHNLWRACGLGILTFYGFTCLLYGGIYRPKGVDLGHPAFYVLLSLPLFPIGSLLLEEYRRRKA